MSQREIAPVTHGQRRGGGLLDSFGVIWDLICLQASVENRHRDLGGNMGAQAGHGSFGPVYSHSSSPLHSSNLNRRCHIVNRRCSSRSPSPLYLLGGPNILHTHISNLMPTPPLAHQTAHKRPPNYIPPIHKAQTHPRSSPSESN